MLCTNIAPSLIGGRVLFTPGNTWCQHYGHQDGQVIVSILLMDYQNRSAMSAERPPFVHTPQQFVLRIGRSGGMAAMGGVR